MQRNRKADNVRFTLFDDGTLHLYDNLIEVETEDGVQYEGDLYVLKTTLTQVEVGQQFKELLAIEKDKWQTHVAKEKAQKAQAYLTSTDWVVAQLGEYQMLGKPLPDRSDILVKREEARQAIRDANK